MSDEILEPRKYSSTDRTVLVPIGLRNNKAADYGSVYGYAYGADDSIDMRRLSRTIRRRKWLIAALAFIITAITGVVMYRAESTYEASTIIEIDEHATLMNPDSSYLHDPGNFSLNLNTKKLMLKSRPVLEDVIVSLKLNEAPRFIAERRSVWDTLKATVGRLQSRGGASPTAGGTPAARASVRSPDEVRLMNAVKTLEDNLTVEQIRDSRALKVSFTHTDPTVAAEVANAVAQSFIGRSFQSKTEKYTNTAGWLARSTQELRAKVKQAEEALANYVREHKIFSINTEGGKGTLTTEKLTGLHDQVMRAEVDRTIKESLYAEVKAGRTAQLPQAFTDQKILELQKELGTLKILDAQLGTKYGPENPQLKAVKQQIAAFQEQLNASQTMLEEKLKADSERALRDERSFKGALAQVKGEAVNENQELTQYNILKQDVETANSLYKDFLQKSNQATVQLAEQYNDVRVIEPAQAPTEPTGPKRLMIILAGLCLSLMAGVGLAFFLENIDNTLRSSEDVDRHMQLPALGVIPTITASKLRSAKMIGGSVLRRLLPTSTSVQSRNGNGSHRSELLMEVDSFSPVAESYRQLRTAVLLPTAGRMVKTLLVTSSLPGEGKTTTTANLAVSLAQTGASVLVVDADLRRPSLHALFGMSNRHGLSTVLSNKSTETEVRALIQHHEASQLYLLTSGPVPSNPAELLGSEQMRHLLAFLKSTFTYVIIDSPPVAPITDGVLLSSIVDGVLLVVHGGKSSREVVQRSRKLLDEVGAKILGIILNNVNSSAHGHYYDKGYYRQRYQAAEAEADQIASGR